jgi:hypothetical protein
VSQQQITAGNEQPTTVEAPLPEGEQLRNSFAGRLGHLIEPVIQPLGFDWKIGVALIASFAAREVLVSTLSIIYNVGKGENEESEDIDLRHPGREGRQRQSRLDTVDGTHPDGILCPCDAVHVNGRDRASRDKLLGLDALHGRLYDGTCVRRFVYYIPGAGRMLGFQ